ncbi:hypothetical protein CEUSTIGMA_g7354.t1 [Chlamydomonas eustigma]|uniref:B9 domain-containing protein 1 n=1 Tax=Chlamydomonas eustigma TaxID=1157962 RepID=A0A250XA17_9CHLO|nr:hypothetical protein CEUSTIGMA_g7354.t1 [Chlamydomonas eustigma]|eukprot:GAX79914.1 hypothetical protein CEUSTIGMA_g7354.t1 [Chlamydomonas eustigma]
MDAPSTFSVIATGQIESALVPDCDNAYLKFQLVAGEDWQLLDGLEEGITQAARCSQGYDQLLVWNFPIDVTYKATNAFGWPQLVVSVYGLDAFGRDVIKGYGCIHLPTCSGRFDMKLRLFKPKSASLMQAFNAWMSGMPAEFADPRFPSYAEGREVTRVESGGVVNVKLNVLTKDMEHFGYSTGAGKDRRANAAIQQL